MALSSTSAVALALVILSIYTTAIADDASVDDLIEQLESPTPEVRGKALQGLRQVPPSDAAARSFVRALGKDQEYIQEFAAATLVRMGSVSVTPLIEGLSASKPGARARAASTLAKMGAPGEALPALLTALRDRDRDVRTRAGVALTMIGAAAMPGLVAALADHEVAVRSDAAYALGQLALRHRIDLPADDSGAAGSSDGPGIR